MLQLLLADPDYSSHIAPRLILRHIDGLGNVPSDLASRGLWAELTTSLGTAPAKHTGGHERFRFTEIRQTCMHADSGLPYMASPHCACPEACTVLCSFTPNSGRARIHTQLKSDSNIRALQTWPVDFLRSLQSTRAVQLPTVHPPTVHTHWLASHVVSCLSSVAYSCRSWSVRPRECPRQTRNTARCRGPEDVPSAVRSPTVLVHIQEDAASP
jgi:hypothetical protein